MDIVLKYISIVVVVMVVARTIYDAACVCFPKWKGVLDLPSSPPVSSLPFYSHGQKVFRSPAFQVSVMVLVNRLLLVVFASVVYSFLESQPIDIWGHFAHVWHKWDTRHFLYIAEHWYPAEGELKTILAYYPMYPMLVKVMNVVVGDYFISGVVVSYICLTVASVYLYKLAELEFGDGYIAKDTVKYLLLFPLSLFATMAYTESTFLMFSVASFYHIRKQNFWWAGILGGCAALTRNQGILLVGPLVYEAVRVAIEQYRAGQRFTWKDLSGCVVPALIVISGFLLYLCVNKSVSGEWFKFLEYQRTNWGQQAIFFADNIVNIYRRIGDGSSLLSIGTWIPSVAIFCFSLLMIAVMTKILPTPYVIYSVAFFVISYSPSWLLSGARYMFVLFPMYMVLARLVSRHRQVSQYVDTFMLFFTMLVCMAFIKHNVF